MFTQGTGFDRHSKSLCWIVASTWLVLSVGFISRFLDSAESNEDYG